MCVIGIDSVCVGTDGVCVGADNGYVMCMCRQFVDRPQDLHTHTPYPISTLYKELQSALLATTHAHASLFSFLSPIVFLQEGKAFIHRV